MVERNVERKEGGKERERRKKRDKTRAHAHTEIGICIAGGRTLVVGADGHATSAQLTRCDERAKKQVRARRRACFAGRQPRAPQFPRNPSAFSLPSRLSLFRSSFPSRSWLEFRTIARRRTRIYPAATNPGHPVSASRVGARPTVTIISGDDGRTVNFTISREVVQPNSCPNTLRESRPPRFTPLPERSASQGRRAASPGGRVSPLVFRGRFDRDPFSLPLLPPSLRLFFLSSRRSLPLLERRDPARVSNPEPTDPRPFCFDSFYSRRRALHFAEWRSFPIRVEWRAICAGARMQMAGSAVPTDSRGEDGST